MEIVELRPKLFACLTGNQSANAGFVVTPRGVVVVDTLSRPALGRQLAEEIGARTDRPVWLVINTHYHYDHVFGNQAFAAPVVASCPLAGELAQAAGRDLAPQALSEWVAAHPEDRWLADELELVYPTIAFESRMVIDAAPTRLVLTHMGGHTPDSTVVDLPDQGVLFAGDLVFEGRVPFLRYAHIGRTAKALRAIEAMGPRTVVPGHGALCDQGYVARLREYLEALLGRVAELAGRGWDRQSIVESDLLPRWWTDDRPDLLRANLERAYEEVTAAGPA